MFDTRYITEWEKSMNRSLKLKGYKILIGLISNEKEGDRCSAFIARLDAEKPKNFYSDDLPDGVWRIDHVTFEGLLPLIERQMRELNIN